VLKLAKKQFTALDWPVKLIIKIMVPLFMPRTSTGHPVTDLQEAFAFAVTLRTGELQQVCA
jgi:hypothetical protein